MSRALDSRALAAEYAALFPSVYLRFHRRTGKRRELSGVSRGVLLHLAQSGPLTVGECARHIQRAQSVVSEIVDQLERHGLLSRVRDERDRRRTLVWLTDRGKQRILEDQEVLSLEALSEAFALMTPAARRALLLGTNALLRAAERAPGTQLESQGEAMTTDQCRCESCSMPIETGPYCQYCVTPSGELQPFDERLEKMIGWQMRQKPGLSREQAERETLAFMAKMPAWRNHPRVQGAG